MCSRTRDGHGAGYKTEPRNFRREVPVKKNVAQFFAASAGTMLT